VEQLGRRLAAFGEDSDALVLYAGDDQVGAGQVAACTALQDVLVRAGLGDEPDVRASSVAAWAGRRILRESGRIDLVAHRLGVRSLDRAARIIAWDWLEESDP
jgi:integrase/recombinase XerC